MSEKIDIIIDSSTDVEAGNKIVSASIDNNIDIEVLEPDYNVTINKREYVITCDNIYIPKTYDESPQWLKDIIGTITDFSLNQKLTEIGALSNTLYALIEELNVAKNTYTNSIISSSEIDERINARIETLNSSIASSDATIVDLIATKATPIEASSLALNVLTASINDGAISSLVSNLQNAISTTNSTLSNNIDIVHSEMVGDFEANAEVVNAIETSVTNINGTLTSHAGQITNLQASASAVDGKIATAKSEVVNTVNTTIANGDAIVESKWAYNSALNIGGNSYNSGFGLSNSSGTGVGSEFWINADKLKFTNSAKTGSKVPFSIDASGPTPQIYFNGRVSFGNVTDVPQLGSTPQEVVTAINNAQTTTINGPRITTGSVTASQIASNTITASQIASNTITASQIASNTITASQIATGSITVDKIASNTITVDRLNATSINLYTLTGSINWNTQVQNKPTSLSSFTNDSGFLTGSYSGFTYIDAYGIYTGNITANQITTGTLNASQITVTNLNASNITTGTLTVLRLPQLSDTKSTTATSTITYGGYNTSILYLTNFGDTVGATISGTVNFPSRSTALGSTIGLYVNGTLVFEYTLPNIGANAFSYAYVGNINSVEVKVRNNEYANTTVTSRNLSIISFFK